MSRTDFDHYAKDYERLLTRSLKGFGADVDYYRRHKAAWALRLAAGASAILDYGCGAGGNLDALARAFPTAELAGCDISDKSLDLARSRRPGSDFFLLGRDPLPEGRFDLVFVSNVLHHVPPGERPGVLVEMARALRPGGRLLVFEHNPKNPLTRHVVGKCPFDADAVLLEAEETDTLAAGAGLTDVTRRFILFFPAALGFLGLLEPLLCALPLGAQYLVTARKPGPRP